MFGVTLRTNFNDCHRPYNDNARPQYQPQPQDAILQHSVVANQLTLLKYNAGLADPQIQAKGDTLYVTGEQVKYRDSREGIIHPDHRIIMNELTQMGSKRCRIRKIALTCAGDDGNRCRQPEKSSRQNYVGPRNDAGAKTRRASGSAVHRQGWYGQIAL